MINESLSFWTQKGRLLSVIEGKEKKRNKNKVFFKKGLTKEKVCDIIFKR